MYGREWLGVHGQDLTTHLPRGLTLAAARRAPGWPRAADRPYNQSCVSYSRPARHELESALGPLEVRVLEALWHHHGPAAVRDLQPGFPGVAYTTLMTTLDRLYRKELLTREKLGRAFAYLPRFTREELHARLASEALVTVLPRDASALRPIISMFVDEVGRRDAAMLDELEALIRERKERG